MPTRPQHHSRLLSALLVLLLLDVMVLPFAAGATYAASADAPDHLLTYTTGSLTWDSSTGIRTDGVALLSLFDSSYQNVQAHNGEHLLAPGTEKTSVIQLKNNAGNPICYTALLYCVKEENTLPAAPGLTGTGFSDTDTYPLPDGVTGDQVVRAVSGTLDAGAVQDFAITWQWNYYDSDARDQIDTALGNQAAFVRADEITAELYIVVEEEGSSSAYILPQVPQTGDTASLSLYVMLLIASGLSLLLLSAYRRKEKP